MCEKWQDIIWNRLSSPSAFTCWGKGNYVTKVESLTLDKHPFIHPSKYKNSWMKYIYYCSRLQKLKLNASCVGFCRPNFFLSFAFYSSFPFTLSVSVSMWLNKLTLTPGNTSIPVSGLLCCQFIKHLIDTQSNSDQYFSPQNAFWILGLVSWI